MEKKIKLTQKDLTRIIERVINEQSRNTDRVKSTDPVDKDTTSPILKALEKTLKTWETKKYKSDEARWKAYFSDIEKVLKKYTK